MKFDWKPFAWGAAGLAAVAAIAWAFAPRPIEVESASVTRGRFERAIEEDGRTRLKERYTVSAPVAGRLARITLREGDRVERGDPVAVLTPVMPAMVDERSRRELSARLEAAKANVDAARAREARARVTLQESRNELDRTQKLARQGFVAESRLDSAKLALDAAQRELEASQAARDLAGHEREQAEAFLRPVGNVSEAGHPLTLSAPVSGRVLKVAVQSEATVAAGAHLLDIGDPKQMEVVAELLTTEAVQAAPGTRVVIERWGGPAVEGRLRLIEPGGFTKVSALGIEEQRVNAVIDLMTTPGAGGALDSSEAWRSVGDGFRVGVRVITTSMDNATLVPVGALFPHAGGMALFRIDGGRAKLQPVELGGRNGSVGWVRTGLEPGQEVILYPPASVKDGSRVHVRTP